MKKSPRKNMKLEELVGHLIAIAGRIERTSNGYLRFSMEFGPRDKNRRLKKSSV